MTAQAMTAQNWIARFADLAGLEPPDPSTVDALLELAGVAAHASERTAAPVTCYLIGLAGLDVESARALADQLADTAS